MSKMLILNNGFQVDVLEASTIYNIIKVFTDPMDVMNVWDQFTKDNLSQGYIGDDPFKDIIPLDLDLIKDDNGLIIARFESRDKTEVELIKDEIRRHYYINIMEDD